jgi:homoserine dehydrogenase
MTRYQITLEVSDQPGVLAKIAQTFANHDVSIETVEQGVRAVAGRKSVAIIEIGTHQASDAALTAVVAALGASDAVVTISSVIRIEGI